MADIENNVPPAEAKAADAPKAPEGRGYESRHRGGGPGGRGGHRRPRNDDDKGDSEFVEKVVFINRSAKVVKGGRRFKFSALVVAGDRKGKVGFGLGKGVEVSDAIKKGGELAKRAMVPVSLQGQTIPHEILCNFDGASILLKPASPGTGIIAGKTVRAVLESAGIKDVLTKSLGSKNAANVVRCTLNALLKLRLPEEIYAARGLKYEKKTKPAVAVVAA